MKRLILIAFALIMLIRYKTLVAQNENNQSEEKINTWTDVVKNTSDPAS